MHYIDIEPTKLSILQVLLLFFLFEAPVFDFISSFYIFSNSVIILISFSCSLFLASIMSISTLCSETTSYMTWSNPTIFLPIAMFFIPSFKVFIFSFVKSWSISSFFLINSSLLRSFKSYEGGLTYNMFILI